MLTLGVDLASKDERTAACLVRWEGGQARLERLLPSDTSDDVVVELGSVADVVAIDAPFGWPIPFVDVVRAYDDGSPWPPTRLSGLWLRRTDLRVQAELGGRSPLSVSSDRIARPAERAARLLTLLGRPTLPSARDGSDAVIEVYPAGALHIWHITTSGYKAPGAMAIRAQIRDTLLGAVRLTVDAEHCAALAEADHPLDALVASLVGRAFALGKTTRPEGDDVAVARREGWIHLPTVALDSLA